MTLDGAGADPAALIETVGLGTVRLYINVLYQKNIFLYASLGYHAEWEETMNGGLVVHMAKRVE